MNSKKITDHKNFSINENDLSEHVQIQKVKNCEGFDRFPQRVLMNGINLLLIPHTKLFHKILQQTGITDQWSIKKKKTIHKKGPKQHIEN